MGAKTGTYRYIDGKMVKVSDKTPPLASRIDGVYFREPYYENFGGAGGKGGVEITSKGHKKAEMEARGIREYEPSIDGDVQFEKSGKIISFPGQKKCDRNTNDYRRQVAGIVNER